MGAAVAYIPELSAADIDEPRATARSDGLVTALRLVYARDWAQGKATKAMLLEAPEAIERYGRSEAEHRADWLHLPRLAFALGETLLRRLARPRWEMSFGVPWRIGLRLAPGQDISISHPRLPVSGPVLVADAQLDWSAATVNVTCWAMAGPAPRVVLAQSAEQFEPITVEYSIEAGGKIVVLMATDASGQPMPGAKVWIDGKGPITADAAAKVRFQARPGTHVVRIEADGKTATTTTVTVR